MNPLANKTYSWQRAVTTAKGKCGVRWLPMTYETKC